MLASHYAPKCRIELVADHAEARRVASTVKNSRILSHWDNTPLYAATLYAQMRQADTDGVELLIAVLPLKTGLGIAICDRLSKAAFA
jgi:hypothetical protein